MSVVAMLLAGGQGSRLSILSQRRAKPAVPFAGSYRIIDFSLSNVMRSGVPYVGILTQYKPYSLMDHIGGGEWWGFVGRNRMARVLPPYTGEDDSDWYAGTADAVWQNRRFVQRFAPEDILVLSGDHVYYMNYDEMIRTHRERNADLTIAMQRVPWEETSRFGVAEVTSDGCVVGFQEKPKSDPISNLASLGIYVFDADVLVRRLQEDALDSASDHDFGKNVIPSMIAQDKVFGHVFEGYWRDVGTIESYWEANMEVLTPETGLDIAGWRVRTNFSERRLENQFPARIGGGGRAVNCHVSRGCVIEGDVADSILSPGVHVHAGATVRNSILMSNTSVGVNTKLDRVITDKNCVIDRECTIGFGSDAANTEQPSILSTGITVIGKNALLPPGVVIGRNVLVCPDVGPADLPGACIESGATIYRRSHII